MEFSNKEVRRQDRILDKKRAMEIIKEGEYGIRIENVLVCEQITDKKLFFWPLTLVPIDLEAIELTLLTEVEKKWINNYHKNIKQILKDYLSDDEFLWLENKYYEI